MVEEEKFIIYMEEMVGWGCPLNNVNISQLKAKTAKIIQTRLTPFTSGVPGKS